MSDIKLLLLDDHALFRESLARLLETEEDFEVVARCSTGAEALRLLSTKEVDVVLLDFDLHDEQGTAFLASARQAGFQGKVLLVTAGISDEDAAAAFQLGASGIFLKHDSPVTLANAIRLINQGGSWLDSRLLQQVAGAGRTDQSKVSGRPITSRERQVLDGIFEGLTNKEIAARLKVSESSVKATLQQLFEKLNVRTRSQLVRAALESPHRSRD